MPPLLSDIMCGFVRHITCTPENIILLIFAGCLRNSCFTLSLNRELNCVFNLFVSGMLLISHGFF